VTRVYRSSQNGGAAKPKRTAKDVVEDVLSGATERRRAAGKKGGAAAAAKTAQQRQDKGNLCGAKKRNGEPCRNFAGQNTNHLGIGACWLHGGRMKSSRKKAAVVKVERELTMLDPVDGEINPAEVMIELLRVSVARARWLDKRLTRLNPDDLFELEGQVLAKFDGDERDRGLRAAKYCIDAGVPEFRVQLEQGQVDMVVQMIKLALVRIGAPPHYAAALGAALRIEGLEAAAQQAGEGIDREERERLEAELARILAEHEPVEDAVVVEPEPVEPVAADAEPAEPEEPVPADPVWEEFDRTTNRSKP
jgi:hypothetical protein